MVGTRPVDAYFARAKESTHQREARGSARAKREATAAERHAYDRPV